MKIDAREFKKAASPVQFYSQMEFTKNPVLEVKPSPEPIIVQETPQKAKFKKGFHFDDDKMDHLRWRYQSVTTRPSGGILKTYNSDQENKFI